jgi:hypothetical protein
MIVLVLIAAWIVVLSLVVGVCASARTGDAHLPHELATYGETRADWLAWESGAETIRITSRASMRAAGATGADELLVASDSLAA